MKKYLLIIFMVVSTIRYSMGQCNVPTVNSFSPTTGFIGSTVTISGSNYDPIAGNNQVFFGATQAQIVSGNFSTLVVKVPSGATYAPITVRNSCGLIGQSFVPFNGIFCGTQINQNSFNTVAYSRSVSGGYGMVSQDMDLDGKPELLIVGFTTNTLGVLRNLSTPGNFSFDNPLNLSVPSNTRCVSTGDFDGDGKVDLALTVNGIGIYIYRNLSTPGSLSFASPLQITGGALNGGTNTYQIASGDLNRDGKLDLAFTAFNSNVYVLRNTSSGAGSISFANAQIIDDTYSLTGIAIVDIDQDGIGDIATSSPGNDKVSVIRNTTTAGSSSLTFDAPSFFNTNSAYPYRMFTGDFDKDGKIDLVTNNYSGATTSVFRNTSSPGSISMNAPVNLPSPTSNYRLGVGDADGDGSPDLVTKSSGENLFSVYKNTSTGSGNISFAARVDYPAQAEVSGIVIADLDGDFVPDISTSGISYNTLRIHRNTTSVTDNTPPDAICKNIDVALDPTGNATITASMVDNGSSDACGVGSMSINRSSFSCADLGQNAVVLTVTDRAGNSSSCTAMVNIVPAAIAIAGNATVCQGQTVSMQANQGDSYQWKKDGTAIDGATSRNYIASVSGDYTVVVTNGGGCSGESPAIHVVISPAPTVTITASGATDICQGNTVTLTASAASNYSWSNGAVTQSIVVSTAGTYSVSVLDANGCSGTSNAITVTVKSAPLPDATITTSGSTSFCQGGSVTLSVPEASSYLWSNGETSRSIVVSSSGVYNVTVTNSDGCFKKSSDVPVTVKPAPTVNAGTDQTKCPENVVQLNAVGNSPIATTPVSQQICLYDANGGNCTFSSNLCNDGYGYQTTFSFNQDVAVNNVQELNYYLYYTPCTNLSTFTFKLNGQTVGSYTDNQYTCTCTPAGFGQYPRVINIPASSFQPYMNASGTNNFAIDVNGNGGSVALAGVVVEVKSPGDSYSWSPSTGLSNSSIANPTATPSATTTYTVTYAISNGCYATDEVTVFVNNDGPSAVCKDVTIDLTDGTHPYQLSPSEINNGSSDPCSDVTLSFGAGQTQYACTDVGNTFPVQLVVTNGQGQSTSCTAQVTVRDGQQVCNKPPVAVCKSIEVESDANCSANITASDIDNGSYDPDGDNITLSISPAGPYSFGVHSVVLTVTDSKGASSSCTAEINVTDHTNPAITCPDSKTVSADPGKCSASNIDLGQPQTSDNCGVASVTNDAPSTFPVGSTTVTWTVTDIHGNSSSCTQIIVVEDREAPVITCPEGKTVSADPGKCFASNIDLGQPQTSDNCGVASVTNDAPSTFPVGSTTVTWTVTDIHGNSSSCTQIIVVEDREAPVVICPEGKTVSADPGKCFASNIDLGQPQTSDNCGVASVTNDAPSTFPVGSTTVTWTVTDIHGNSSSCTQTIVVKDNEAPHAICRNFTLNLSGGTGSISVNDINNGSWDNCGIANMSLSKTSFNCSNAGSNTVTLTVTDVNGLVSTCTAIVTVQYQPASSITVIPSNNIFTGNNPKNLYIGYGPQSVTLQANASGGSGFTYSWSPSSGLSASNISNPVFNATTQGYFTYTVTITNSNGCVTTSSVTLCVKDVRSSDKGKVLLCHVPPGNASNPQSLSIASNAVPSHLGQHPGDALGACNNLCGANARLIDNPVGEIIVSNTFDVIVYPNPFDKNFTTRIESTASDYVNIKLMDITGRLIKDLPNQKTNEDILITNELAPGVYLINVQMGDEIKVIRVVKE